MNKLLEEETEYVYLGGFFSSIHVHISIFMLLQFPSFFNLVTLVKNGEFLW